MKQNVLGVTFWVYHSGKDFCYMSNNGAFCTKNILSAPPSGRLISNRWNGAKKYRNSLFCKTFFTIMSLRLFFSLTSQLIPTEKESAHYFVVSSDSTGFFINSSSSNSSSNSSSSSSTSTPHASRRTKIGAQSAT
jgi:hypothetical protein